MGPFVPLRRRESRLQIRRRCRTAGVTLADSGPKRDHDLGAAPRESVAHRGGVEAMSTAGVDSAPEVVPDAPRLRREVIHRTPFWCG